MTSRKIVAVFDSSEAAQMARTRLLERGIGQDRITIADQSNWDERKLETPQSRGSFWTHVKEMFMPEQDRQTYEETLRRGGCLLVATVDEDAADTTVACLEQAGAVDLDTREGQWRSEGWQPRQPAAGARVKAPKTQAADTTDTGNSNKTEEIPVVEEHLLVGKREVNRGTVRVRSYIVEEPAHEEVRLREERVSVERRPVNEPARPVAKGSSDDLLQERTLEVSETAEQAVVGKEARVTEQVVVGKTTQERLQPIDETVRRTKVEIEDDRTDTTANRTAKPETRNPPPPSRRP